MQFFYCTGGKIREVAGVFLAKKHSPDAGSDAPDVVSVRPVCRQCLAQLGLGAVSRECFLWCPSEDDFRATPLSRRTTKCWSTQQGRACQQAREPQEKIMCLHCDCSLDFS